MAGVVQASKPSLQIPQVGQDQRAGRFGAGGLFVGIQRFGLAVHHIQQRRLQVVADAPVGKPRRQCLRGGQRIGQVGAFGLDARLVDIGPFVVRIQLDGLVDQLKGRGQIALLVLQLAQEQLDVGIAGM
ncbi:hypothetical protein D3C85_1089240 [compost metagenome]